MAAVSLDLLIPAAAWRCIGGELASHVLRLRVARPLFNDATVVRDVGYVWEDGRWG